MTTKSDSQLGAGEKMAAGQTRTKRGGLDAAKLILLHEQGFVVVGPLLTAGECDDIVAKLVEMPDRVAGTRTLLARTWCIDLACRLASHPSLRRLLPAGAVPLQCTLFEKTPRRNWLVALHQDLGIPVAARVEDPALSGWTRKEGVLSAQPPVSLLSELLAVRLQLDDCVLEDGCLRVVPGSHLRGRIGESDGLELRDRVGETVCAVPRGSALLMRPLLLHASSKLNGPEPRRVLHFLFGPRELPFGLKPVWGY